MTIWPIRLTEAKVCGMLEVPCSRVYASKQIREYGYAQILTARTIDGKTYLVHRDKLPQTLSGFLRSFPVTKTHKIYNGIDYTKWTEYQIYKRLYQLYGKGNYTAVWRTGQYIEFRVY